MKTLYSFSLIALIALLSTSTTLAQAPVIEWQKNFGGSDGDGLFIVHQTTDGGYIHAGMTYSNDDNLPTAYGKRDCWVVKTNEAGNIEWQKLFGGSGYDIMEDFKPTSDGGYIFAATTNSTDGDIALSNGDNDIWIVKLNAEGDIEWQKSFGTELPENVASIIPTNDGGYAVIGNDATLIDAEIICIVGDLWVLKLTASGEIEWEKRYGGSGGELPDVIIQTIDGGYMISAMVNSFDGDLSGIHDGEETENAWLLKIDSSGDIEWQHSLGGYGMDYFPSVIQTADGGYVFIGSTDSTEGDTPIYIRWTDYWLVKTDSEGIVEWEKRLGGSFWEEAFHLEACPEGGYIVIGYTSSIDGDVTGLHNYIPEEYTTDIWVVKTDDTGNIEWEKCLGGSQREYGAYIKPTIDGGYIVAGTSSSSDGDVTGNNGDEDAWIIKLTFPVNINEKKDTVFSLYPNPATDNITLSNIERGSTVTINDIAGKLFHQSVINDVQTTIDTKLLSSGVYTVQVKNENRVSTHKLVIDK